MRPGRTLFLAAFLGLTVVYSVVLEPGGFRLPRYYTPDGLIIPIGHVEADWLSSRFVEIDGKDPLDAPALFVEAAPVLVVLDDGPGLMRVVPNRVGDLVFDFKFVILFSYVFLFCALWFLRYSKDIHLSALSILLSLFYFCTVTSLAAHSLHVLWQVSALALLPAMFNMGLRTTGREVPGLVILAECILVLFFSLISSVGSAETYLRIRVGTAWGFFIVTSIVVALQVENARRGSDSGAERAKRWALALGTAVGILLPALALVFLPFWHKEGDPLIILIFPASLFPAALLYGGYRGPIPGYQLIVTRSIVGGLFTLTLAVVYAAALLTYNLFFPDQEGGYRWIIHVLFILVLVFFLDPTRRFLTTIADTRLFRLDAELSESLKRMGLVLSSPLKIQSTVSSFLSEMKDTLGAVNVSFLFETNAFVGLNIRPPLVRIPASSPIWPFVEADRIAVMPHLVYGGGPRAELYQFLRRNEIYLAIGIAGERQGFLQPLIDRLLRRSAPGIDRPAIRAAVLIGLKENGRRYTLAELRYIQEATRLAGLLVYNYTVLIQEVQKRGRMRELLLAGQTQRSITRSGGVPAGLHISSFNLPVISVTGDYLDLIPLKGKTTAILLGDVTGHGLGTGYLVSAIRAIVHSHLQSGAPLVDTMQALNQFLMNRYRGNEFLTLFACLLNVETGRMEYVNSAHPGPYLKTPGDTNLLRLRDSQRLLGVLTTPYHSTILPLRPGQRLFLYSDGVTETFNEKDEPFGDAALQEFLAQNGDNDLDDVAARLRERLEDFRGVKRPGDDTTFLALEFAPRPAALRGFFSFLGGERN